MNGSLPTRIFLLLGGIALLWLVVLMAIDRMGARKPPPDDDDISGWGV